MPLTRLLAASLLASALVLPALAQSPATAIHLTTTFNAATPTLTLNAPSTAPSTFLQSAKLGDFHFNLSKDKSELALHTSTRPFGIDMPESVVRELSHTLMAQVHSPCYTMRSYGFTAQDLQSATPHASNYTDCAAASSAKLKAILSVTPKQP